MEWLRKQYKGIASHATIFQLNITPEFLCTEWLMVELTWNWRYQDLMGKDLFKTLCIPGFVLA
jgi:hypothetical protein